LFGFIPWLSNHHIELDVGRLSIAAAPIMQVWKPALRDNKTAGGFIALRPQRVGDSDALTPRNQRAEVLYSLVGLGSGEDGPADSSQPSAYSQARQAAQAATNSHPARA